MKKPRSAPAVVAPPAGDAPATTHRSGAVARMLRMPVATLRVWERRYALTQPQLSPSGQRLYSADDVRRLALIKQLTDLGHAIGSLAGLDMAQLQQVASTHAHTLMGLQPGAAQPAHPAPAPQPQHAWRLAVIGATLGARLQRPALLRRLTRRGRSVSLLGPFADVVEAEAALHDTEVDALLIHEPRLHPGWLAGLDHAAPGLANTPKAVVYGFAAEAVCDALATAGVSLLRGPQPDAVLAQWLGTLPGAMPPAPQPMTAPAASKPPPPRWSDAALADFAGLSTTIACECPRHVAELLMQLSHFEAYSAECQHRGAADARLHAYLGQIGRAHV